MGARRKNKEGQRRGCGMGKYTADYRVGYAAPELLGRRNGSDHGTRTVPSREESHLEGSRAAIDPDVCRILRGAQSSAAAVASLRISRCCGHSEFPAAGTGDFHSVPADTSPGEQFFQTA